MRLQLAILLTVALLPFGIIAVWQAATQADVAQRMSERALLGETLRAAAAQREALYAAQANARILSHLLSSTNGDCTYLVVRFAEAAAPAVRLAAMASTDGKVLCTSQPGGLQGFHASESFRRLGASPNGDLHTASDAAGLDTLLVSSPVTDSYGDLIGHALLAVPRTELSGHPPIPGDGWTGVEPTVLTFDAQGRVLSSTVDPAMTEAMLLSDGGLKSQFGRTAGTFRARDVSGSLRSYAVVPVVDGSLCALGAWPLSAQVGQTSARLATLGVVLPILMWVASLLVAYLALNRLVVLPLRQLSARMVAFTEGERLLPPMMLGSAPQELRDTAGIFEEMVKRIADDEAQLAQSVHTQDVLLKEVHHRVKNNLQLIGSILNMQRRQQSSPEARALLRRVQDRVMGLAAVHQHLYKSSALSSLRADALLSDILARLLSNTGAAASRIEVESSLAPVTLYPDQAVALALLTSEAVTNALWHIGVPEAGQPRLAMQLDSPGAGAVRLIVRNTLGATLSKPEPGRRPGIGTRLMEAFADQLGTKLNRRSGDGEFEVNVTFKIVGFDQDPDEEALETQSITGIPVSRDAH